jgi:hypothetical protein
MHDEEKHKAKDRRSSYMRTAYDPVQSVSRRMVFEPDTQSRPQSLSRPPSIADVNARSRPPSIRSERIGPGPSSLRTPPMPSPPAHPRAHTMQSVEDLQEEKRRRRMSNVSEGAGSIRTRVPSAPSASGQTAMRTQTLPRAYSSGPGMSGMSMMPMPVPPMPVHVMPMPVFVMPGMPQYYIPQQMPMPQQQQHHAPLLPPIRPGLLVSRSTEGLSAPRSHHSGQQDSSSSRPVASRRASNGDAVKNPSRLSVQVPPVSHMPSASHRTSGSRGPKPSPLR